MISDKDLVITTASMWDAIIVPIYAGKDNDRRGRLSYLGEILAYVLFTTYDGHFAVKDWDFPTKASLVAKAIKQ